MKLFAYFPEFTHCRNQADCPLSNFNHFANFDGSQIFENKLFECNARTQGALQKFCVAQPFSACGNNVAPKMQAHVTEGSPSAHAKFRSNQLKIMR